ncbi:hypothetical protein TNCV_3246331 [Trichonephila clavipes]|nr:hypothetical protein TNCV_3246331 [Trichonephila clavipes]
MAHIKLCNRAIFTPNFKSFDDVDPGITDHMVLLTELFGFWVFPSFISLLQSMNENKDPQCAGRSCVGEVIYEESATIALRKEAHAACIAVEMEAIASEAAS